MADSNALKFWEWQLSLERGRAARANGQIGRTLANFELAVAGAPQDCAVLLEVADYVADLNRNLDEIEPIYARHRAYFGLSAEDFPRHVAGCRIGSEGWSFVDKCLAEAWRFTRRAPHAPELLLRLAQHLERRGDGQKVQLLCDEIRNADDFDAARDLGTSLEIGRLLEAAGGNTHAADWYRTLHSLHPRNLACLVRLASLQARHGAAAEFRATIAVLDKLITAICQYDPDEQAFMLLDGALTAATAPQHDALSAVTQTIRAAFVAAPQLDASLDGHAAASCRAASPVLRLTDAFLSFAEGRREEAGDAFYHCLTRGKPDAPDQHAFAAVADRAWAWAEAIVADPACRPSGTMPQSIDRTALALAMARRRAAAGASTRGLLDFALALRRYHVPDTPMRYELVDDFKVVLHEKTYFAIPSEIRDMVIRKGKVYKLSGISRSTRSKLPPWLVELLYPHRKMLSEKLAAARHGVARVKAAVGQCLRTLAVALRSIVSWSVRKVRTSVAALRAAIRDVVRTVWSGLGSTWDFAMRGPRFGKRILLDLMWERHRVRGVIVGDRRSNVLSLIAKAKGTGGPFDRMDTAAQSGKPRRRILAR